MEISLRTETRCDMATGGRRVHARSTVGSQGVEAARWSRWLLRSLACICLSVLTVPIASAGFFVAGNGLVSTVSVGGQDPLEGQAYMLGFRTNPNDESAYQWGFRAESVQVHIQKKHYVGDIFPIHQGTTEKTITHSNSTGVLLKHFPLAYFLAVSADENDPGLSFDLTAAIPLDSLELRRTIAYSTDRLEEDDELPFQDADPFDGRWYREYRQPWNNFFYSLEDPTPLTLYGDFTLHIWEMKFQVRNGTGEETIYNATFGGGRGDDVPSPLHEYNNTFAELRFTNASFTFLPAGRPMQLNLQSAAANITGAAYLSDVEGSLAHRGVDVKLDASFVEFDAEDLRMDMRPTEDGNVLRLGITFDGLLHSATIDGRALELGQDDSAVPEMGNGAEPSTNGAIPATPLSPWWVILLLAGMGIAFALAHGISSSRARKNPEAVTQQGESALDKGHNWRARTLAKRVLRHHPHHHNAVALHAMTHLNRRQNSEALAVLEPYLLGPADEEGRLSLIYALTLRKERGVNKARAFFEKASKRFPSIAEAALEYPDLADLMSDDAGEARGGVSYH